ncbi:hypothetical protein [Streptosporangium sp. NPDC002524]|uniref:hypothetical protein n=1 Tax=Streptosporangium sp. NPDC002524 TaxID=3154537 RepID=UPI003327E672
MSALPPGECEVISGTREKHFVHVGEATLDQTGSVQEQADLSLASALETLLKGIQANVLLNSASPKQFATLLHILEGETASASTADLRNLVWLLRNITRSEEGGDSSSMFPVEVYLRKRASPRLRRDLVLWGEEKETDEVEDFNDSEPDE